MVGGKIIGLARKREWIGGRGPITTVHVRDTHCTDTCCIDVVERTDDAQPWPLELYAGRGLDIGDSIWWQDRKAMWTPHGNTSPLKPDNRMEDIAIPRIGYSHSGGHAMAGED